MLIEFTGLNQKALTLDVVRKSKNQREMLRKLPVKHKDVITSMQKLRENTKNISVAVSVSRSSTPSDWTFADTEPSWVNRDYSVWEICKI